MSQVLCFNMFEPKAAKCCIFPVTVPCDFLCDENLILSNRSRLLSLRFTRSGKISRETINHPVFQNLLHGCQKRFYEANAQ